MRLFKILALTLIFLGICLVTAAMITQNYIFILNTENLTLFINSLSQILEPTAWPITILIIVFLFRAEMIKLLNRISKAKFGDNEIEFTKEEFEHDVKEFIESSKKSEEAIEAEKLIADEDYIPILKPERTRGFWANISDKIEYEPSVAIILIAAEIEKHLREELLRNGIKPFRRGIVRLGEQIVKELNFHKSFSSALREFAKVRNKISHGESINVSDLQDIAHNGLELLDYIYTNQTPPCFIETAGMPVYKDPECSKRLKEFEGVIILFGAIPGATGANLFSITDRKNYYKPHTQVVSEWLDISKKYKKYSDTKSLWIKYSESNEIIEVDIQKYGLFQGKNLHDIDY